MKNTESKSNKGELLSWEAPEFEYREKEISWYLVTASIGVVLILLALWQKNFLFAAFVLIAWFVIVYWANKKPIIWRFKLDEKGISIILPGEDFDKFHPYDEFEGFDVHEGEGEKKELLIKPKSKLSSYLKILFPVSKEKNIVDFLSKFLSHEEYEKSASDSFLKLIKF